MCMRGRPCRGVAPRNLYEQDYRGLGGGGWPGFKVPVVSYAPRPMLIVTALLFLLIIW